MWLYNWESETFKQDIEKLYKEVEPLFKKLHAFVRMKIKKFYKNQRFPKDGTIPAHVLGNMWAQSWGPILNKIDPFPEVKSIDISEEMKKQKFDQEKMAKVSKKFQTDLGLLPMTHYFWKKSIFKQPEDVNINCVPSSWTFYEKNDFR